MNLYSPAEVKALREKHGFKNSKSLGQNFITDRNTIEKIIEGAEISENDLVIEIGPGMGVLTRAAAEAGKKVIAIEIDSGLLPVLNETLEDFDNVEIINADILKTDLNEIIEKNRVVDGVSIENVRIIGNLPYYITTPIIMKILEDDVRADSITAMMQKEVAERIVSDCGSRTYGAVSVAAQYYCEIENVCTVSRNVFLPPPKVDSAVLRFRIRNEKPVHLESEKAFFNCIKAAFGQRRKTLENSLSGTLGKDKETIRKVLEGAGIEAARRAETLSIEEFADLANEMVKEKIFQG